MSLIIETDLKELLNRIDQKIDNIQRDVTDLKIGVAELKGEIRTVDGRLSGQIETLDERISGQIKTVDERISGQIKTVDERLSGQIKTVDERLSGQINILDTKIDGLSTRVQNQEFTSRAILGGLLLIVLGGAAKMFNFLPPGN
jgi:chromosome segregation ATPase